MTEAFIYDHVRSPRGRGKPGGALHAVTPINLATQVLRALRDRNELDTGILDDVILGCVAPVGEQGANVGRMAAMISGFDDSVPGVQLNRFCSSGLEAVNIAAAKVKAGDVDLVVAGHTHGGQVCLPGIGPLFTCTQVPQPVAAGGLHRLLNRWVYVSRGSGHERGQAPRIRLFCPPEVSILTLVAP